MFIRVYVRGWSTSRRPPRPGFFSLAEGDMGLRLACHGLGTSVSISLVPALCLVLLCRPGHGCWISKQPLLPCARSGGLARCWASTSPHSRLAVLFGGASVSRSAATAQMSVSSLSWRTDEAKENPPTTVMRRGGGGGVLGRERQGTRTPERCQRCQTVESASLMLIQRRCYRPGTGFEPGDRLETVINTYSCY